MSPGHVLRDGVWVTHDEDLVWREEAFGEHPMLDALGNPFRNEEPLECGVENPEVCESCQ